MAQQLTIGEWVVETALNTLRRGDTCVQVEPKTMQVLLCLAREPGEVFGKERIIEEVWPDTFVTDGVLWNAISELRGAFGDDPKRPKFIETVPRRGYRLVASASSDLGTCTAPARSFRLNRIPAIAGAGALFIILLIFLSVDAADSQITKPASLAVLPFVSSRDLTDGFYVKQAISASLSSILFEARGLRVIPSSALQRFQPGSVDPLMVAGDLGVDCIVYGVLSGGHDQYNLNLELLDARTRKLLWAGKYRGDLESLNSVQSRVARSILAETTGELDQQILSLLTHQLPIDKDAQSAYLKGRYFYNHYLFKDPEFGLSRCTEFLRGTISLEPTFGPAYHWASKAYYHLGTSRQSEADLLEARRWAEEALKVAPSSAEAHQWMGQLLWSYDRDWRGADQHFATANELNPLLGPSIPYLLISGESEKAIMQIEREYSMADPWSVTDAVGHGWWFFFAHHYDRAIELATKALNLEPDLPLALRLLAACYEQQGRFEEAVETDLRALTRVKGELVGQPGISEKEAGHLLRAFRTSGIQAYWRDLLVRALPRGNPIAIAPLYGRLGDYEQSLKWLVKAYELKPMGLLASPWFDSLRDDPTSRRRLADLGLLPQRRPRLQAATGSGKNN